MRLLLILLLQGCSLFSSHKLDENPPPKPREFKRIIIKKKSIDFADKICEKNDHVRHIELYPKKVIVCGNGLSFFDKKNGDR